MSKDSFLHKVFDLYYDGILKVFFFPNFLKEHAQGDESGYVANELVNRSQ